MSEIVEPDAIHADSARRSRSNVTAVGPKPDEVALKPVDEYVASELSTAWSKKGSLESRSIAIITVNTGLATLYIAVQTQFGFTGAGLPYGSKVAAVIGLFLAIASIAFAVVAIVPTGYKQPTETALMALFERAANPKYHFSRMEVIETRISEYADVARQNRNKAILVTWAFSCLGTFAAALVTAIVLATF